MTLPGGTTPANISIFRGNNQRGAPGTMLADSIMVQVTDSAGAPVAGQRVEFTPDAPGSAVAPQTVTTDADGLAGARWVLGTSAGPQVVLARVSGAADGQLQVAFTASAEAGLPSASGLVVVAQPSASVTEDVPFAQQPVIQLRSPAGADVHAAGVAVTAAIVSGSGALTGTTTRLTDANGTAVFSDLQITGATGQHTLIFAALGYSSVTSDPIDVRPAVVQQAATETRITGHDPDPSAPGQSVVVRYTVTSDGATPTGTVTVTASGGSESCSATVAAGSCALVLTSPGNRTLTASYSGDDRFLSSSDQEKHRVKADGGGGGGGGGANLPPTATSDDYQTLEGFDHPLVVGSGGGVLQNDRDPEGRTLFAGLTGGPQNGRVTLRSDGSFTYTPDHDWFGDDQFSYRATDDGGNSSTAVVTVHVAPVNDSPRFKDRGNPPPVGPGAGPQTIPNWAYDINPGNMENDQTVEFVVIGNSNPGLFASGPAVSTSGTLTYTPSGQTGTATITVVPRDNGGTANGGADTGQGHSFTITIR